MINKLPLRPFSTHKLYQLNHTVMLSIFLDYKNTTTAISSYRFLVGTLFEIACQFMHVSQKLKHPT